MDPQLSTRSPYEGFRRSANMAKEALRPHSRHPKPETLKAYPLLYRKDKLSCMSSHAGRSGISAKVGISADVARKMYSLYAYICR